MRTFFRYWLVMWFTDLLVSLLVACFLACVVILGRSVVMDGA